MKHQKQKEAQKIKRNSHNVTKYYTIYIFCFFPLDSLYYKCHKLNGMKIREKKILMNGWNIKNIERITENKKVYKERLTLSLERQDLKQALVQLECLINSSWRKLLAILYNKWSSSHTKLEMHRLKSSAINSMGQIVLNNYHSDNNTPPPFQKPFSNWMRQLETNLPAPTVMLWQNFNLNETKVFTFLLFYFML